MKDSAAKRANSVRPKSDRTAVLLGPDGVEVGDMPMVELVRQLHDQALEMKASKDPGVRRKGLKLFEHILHSAAVGWAHTVDQQTWRSLGGKAGAEAKKLSVQDRHKRWAECGRRWMEVHRDPRGVTSHVAKRFNVKDTKSVRKVLREKGVI